MTKALVVGNLCSRD